jgi:hypothetical protein
MFGKGYYFLFDVITLETILKMSEILCGTTPSSGMVPLSAYSVVHVPIRINLSQYFEVPACLICQYIRGHNPEYR